MFDGLGLKKSPPGSTPLSVCGMCLFVTSPTLNLISLAHEVPSVFLLANVQSIKQDYMTLSRDEGLVIIFSIILRLFIESLIVSLLRSWTLLLHLAAAAA